MARDSVVPVIGFMPFADTTRRQVMYDAYIKPSICAAEMVKDASGDNVKVNTNRWT